VTKSLRTSFTVVTCIQHPILSQSSCELYTFLSTGRQPQSPDLLTELVRLQTPDCWRSSGYSLYTHMIQTKFSFHSSNVKFSRFIANGTSKSISVTATLIPSKHSSFYSDDDRLMNSILHTYAHIRYKKVSHNPTELCSIHRNCCTCMYYSNHDNKTPFCKRNILTQP